MKIKKILSLVIAATLCIVSIVSVSAVDYASTNVTTMNGYEIYGTLTAYPSCAYGHTYCENLNAYKMAETHFAYYGKDGEIRSTSNGGAGYQINNQTSLTIRTPGVDTSSFDGYAGAKTYSKVKFPAPYSHYEWSSDDTDTPLRLGWYVNNN